MYGEHICVKKRVLEHVMVHCGAKRTDFVRMLHVLSVVEAMSDWRVNLLQLNSMEPTDLGAASMM